MARRRAVKSQGRLGSPALSSGPGRPGPGSVTVPLADRDSLGLRPGPPAGRRLALRVRGRCRNGHLAECSAIRSVAVILFVASWGRNPGRHCYSFCVEDLLSRALSPGLSPPPPSVLKTCCTRLQKTAVAATANLHRASPTLSLGDRDAPGGREDHQRNPRGVVTCNETVILLAR